MKNAMETTNTTTLPSGYKIYEGEVFSRNNRFNSYYFAAPSKAALAATGVKRISIYKDPSARLCARAAQEIALGQESLAVWGGYPYKVYKL